MTKSRIYSTSLCLFLAIPECCHTFRLSPVHLKKPLSLYNRESDSLILQQRPKLLAVQSGRAESKLRSQRGGISDEEKKLEVRSATPEQKLDDLLSKNELREAIVFLKQNPSTSLTKERLESIFDSIEYRTSQREENFIPLQDKGQSMLAYPPTSKARTEMTDMYQTLKDVGVLSLFGAVTKDTMPAAGSKIVTPTNLETITKMSMTSLTPKNSNSPLLIAGALLAILEGFVSLSTGIDYSLLVGLTLLLGVLDKLFLNGATFEQIVKIIWPQYTQKVIRHEAGHFLLSYLLGCPVEGCVLSSLAAMKDYRFGGPFTSVSAGTSFFDPELSEQVNNIKPLSRASIDRFTVIVMAGIAAEAINFGGADGGAGDEATLVRFLSQINPRGGGAKTWDGELIRNQARWGATQAVLLLKHYRPVYDALVDALERGGNLGECIYAIEKASRDNALAPLRHPIGFIKDTGLFGEWEPYSPETSSVVQQNVANAAEQGKARDAGASSEEFLSTYKKLLEEKLKSLDTMINSE